MSEWRDIESAPTDRWVVGYGTDAYGTEYEAYLKIGKETKVRKMEVELANAWPAVTFTHWREMPSGWVQTRSEWPGRWDYEPHEPTPPVDLIDNPDLEPGDWS